MKSKEDMRKLIVNAACDIFARFGYKKSTMDEIAQAAHKAKSSIYHYFESKEEIFRAVVEKESQLLKEMITEAINQEDTPQKKLRAYVTTRMRILSRLSNFYSALKDEYFEQYSFIEKMREKYLKDEIRLVKKILKNGVEQGEFVVKDMEITAFTIITALKGLEYPWAIENDSSKTEENIDHLLEILFNGIVRK
jgi:AcrR family transcriptional regulator